MCSTYIVLECLNGSPSPPYQPAVKIPVYRGRNIGLAPDMNIGMVVLWGSGVSSPQLGNWHRIESPPSSAKSGKEKRLLLISAPGLQNTTQSTRSVHGNPGSLRKSVQHHPIPNTIISPRRQSTSRLQALPVLPLPLQVLNTIFNQTFGGDVEGTLSALRYIHHNIGKESSVSKASGTTSRNTNSESSQQGMREERQRTITGQEELGNMICATKLKRVGGSGG